MGFLLVSFLSFFWVLRMGFYEVFVDDGVNCYFVDYFFDFGVLEFLVLYFSKIVCVVGGGFFFSFIGVFNKNMKLK